MDGIALGQITHGPLLDTVLAEPTAGVEVTIWERPDREGGRERVISGPAREGPPGPDAPRVGAVALAPDGRLAFATGTPTAPALALRAPGGPTELRPTPAPVLGVAWTDDGPLIRVELSPGQPADAGPLPPRAPGAARVRAWTTRPIRDWDRWREEREPALLSWTGAGWRTAWRGSVDTRLIDHAAHPTRPGVALLLRRRGADAQDHDALWMLEDGGLRPLIQPHATTLGELQAGAWGLTWTQHQRPRRGFGGPVAARRPWHGSPEVLGLPGGTWHVGHGFIGLDGDVLISVAREGRRILQRIGAGGITDLAAGISQARGHATGWTGVQSGIGRAPRRVSHQDPQDLRARAHPVEAWGSRAADGTRTHSWVVHAGGPGPRPTLLWVHGGPLSQWADTWHPRWSPGVFVERGYTVLMPNPRGSLGRGPAFRDAAGDNRWGEGPIDDLLAAVEAAGAHPAVDPARVAVLGASFGGWAAAWLAATTRRFACAVVHAAPSHLAALHGDTDVPGFLETHMGGTPRAGGPADRWSPLHRVRGWRTPTLITHGERDMRVPVGQAIALYAALHRSGADVSLRVYPEAHHWLTRPADIEDWHAAVFAFLARHLGPPDQR